MFKNTSNIYKFKGKEILNKENIQLTNTVIENSEKKKDNLEKNVNEMYFTDEDESEEEEEEKEEEEEEEKEEDDDNKKYIIPPIFPDLFENDIDRKTREETKNIEKEGNFKKFGKSLLKEIKDIPKNLKDGIKNIPKNLKDGVKNEINSKKKAFNSMFGLSGLRFKTDEEKIGNQNKFNSREEFLAWNSAQNFAKGLNDKIKSLRAKIGDKFSFLKFYKENDDEIDEVLKKRPENSKFNDKGIEFFTYWDIEKLNGKNLNEYINKAQEHIENLKSYSKELDEFSKTHGIPMPDSDSKKYKNYYNNNDYDNNKNNKTSSDNDLKTILIATGYFIKEVIDKNQPKKPNNSQATTKQESNSYINYLNSFWKKHYQSIGNNEIILGEILKKKFEEKKDKIIKYFNEKPKEIIEEALKLAGNSQKAQNIINFFEKISKDGLQEKTSYDKKTLQSYINDRQQEKPVL